MKKEKEIWKDIWNGLYSVSNYGNIRSNDRYINTVNGIRKFTGKLLKTDPTKDNHLRVTLSNAGIKKRIFVHRLVAECFIPNPLNLPIINHIDEDPTNNYYKNLEWCTLAENTIHAYKNKLINNHNSVEIIENGMKFRTMTQCQNWLRKNGYPKAKLGNIALVIQGKRNYAYGFTYRYIDKII